jgi:nucleotide-binding universal stress UspA family protein
MAQLLIAYDDSPSAATAVRAAAGLFPGARASVAMAPSEPSVHAGAAGTVLVGGSPTSIQQAFEELAAVDRRFAADTAERGAEQARTLGLDAESVIIDSSGPAWRSLLDTARSIGADVLVCGTRGRGAFARALLGSTSSSLLHHTDIPLLVVPDGGGSLAGPVVAAYDGSDEATRTIEAVGRLLPGHSTVVVHAWHPPFRPLTALPVADALQELRDAIATEAAGTTETGLAAARAAGLDAVGDTVEADEGVWRAVAATARGHGASVVALGTRGLGAARSVLLGSVSSGLVHNAELPLLVVPGPA